ncbi:MAG: tetratricopeptide repeat protein [Chloroflexi bacterium]|nr:tetratricopeptide repeat protein [Chloroflexota bacterium]
MFNRSFINHRGKALILTICLVIALSGCASGAKLTYKASGTASQAEVEYRGEKGDLTKETVTLPWEKTISIGNEFAFQVNVTSTVSSGTVSCAASLNDKEMGKADGVTYARCTGNVSIQGSSAKWNAHGEYDKPKAAQQATPTVAATRAVIPTSAPTRAVTPTVAPTRAVIPTSAATATPLTATHTTMGIQYAKEGKLDQAIAEFKKAIELDPTNPSYHRNLGSAYYAQGKFNDAVAAFEQAIKLNPRYGEAYGDLTAAYVGLGKFTQAVESGKKAIELAPKYPNAYNNLGQAYYGQGKLDEALAQFLNGAKVDATDANLHKNLGIVYRELGKYTQAITELETYQRFNPNASDKKALETDIAAMKQVTTMATQQYRQLTGGYTVIAPKTWFKAEKSSQMTLSDDEKALGVANSTALKTSPVVVFGSQSKAAAAKSLGVKETADAAEFVAAGAKADKMTLLGVTQVATLNGSPGAVADVSGTIQDTPYKGSLMFMLAGQQVIYAMAMAPSAEWPTYAPLFRIMLMSCSASK